MNLHEQLGALESSLNTLLQAAASAQSSAESAPAPTSSREEARTVNEPPSLDESRVDEPTALNEPPTLTVSRPQRDAIEMTIGDKSVLLSAQGISELIEELSNVRASMSVEQPGGIAPGWRFATTKNPIMAVQKQPNGDRLLIIRHNGHGWVPFTFSPNMVIELYAMLTQK
ncbi:putative tail fiber protein [Candidatus Burkholderia verschuerenii]|uniref:Putative tail fiber protein n=1 Tax=Candidatus Burkholderia verschuerenii TaxID=242163 RepID=A0A0L0MK31_9BURK|nr:hypothetical protein [Candidatus Burkholderia verschuerenii]KND62379.1 putative tail fiber protein [Candidatus Burkholderia verschuerenii]